MTSSIRTAGPAASSARPLIPYALIALPAGWVFLSVPLVTSLPVEPFVLATLFIGMVPAALVLTRRSPQTPVRALLRDCVRLPRPWPLLVPAVLLIPVTTWLAGSVAGAATPLTTGFVMGLAVNVISSVAIVNLWEEMVWAGFVQRRADARWGYVRAAALTALLFTGVHLPLALYDADDAGRVALNVAAMLAAGLGMRLLIGALDRWGNGSILALGLLHAAFNASSDLLDADHDWIRYVVTLGLGLLLLTVPSLRRVAEARR